MCAKLQETLPQHLKIMFAVSSDIFTFLLASALGLTIFLQFSDFQDIYRGMEVCGIRDSRVQWGCIYIVLIIYKSVTPIFSLVTEYCEAIFIYSEKAMAPHSSTLAWKIPWAEEPCRLQSMGSRRVEQLSNFTFTFHVHALEKEMATHSSVLAWRIPGTGEPGGLHRVRHD